MKVILEVDGDRQKFENILCSMDDSFNVLDSIIYELDYGEGESFHDTEHGAMKITVENKED